MAIGYYDLAILHAHGISVIIGLELRIGHKMSCHTVHIDGSLGSACIYAGR